VFHLENTAITLITFTKTDLPHHPQIIISPSPNFIVGARVSPGTGLIRENQNQADPSL